MNSISEEVVNGGMMSSIFIVQRRIPLTVVIPALGVALPMVLLPYL